MTTLLNKPRRRALELPSPPPVPPPSGDLLPESPPAWYFDIENLVESDPGGYAILQAVAGYNSFGSAYANKRVVVRPPISGAPFCYDLFNGGGSSPAVKALVQIGGVMQIDSSARQRCVFLGATNSGATVTEGTYHEGISGVNGAALPGDWYQVNGGLGTEAIWQNLDIGGIRYTTPVHGDGGQWHGGFGFIKIRNCRVRHQGQGLIFRGDGGHAGTVDVADTLIVGERYASPYNTGPADPIYAVNATGNTPPAAAPHSTTYTRVYLGGTHESNIKAALDHENFSCTNHGNNWVTFEATAHRSVNSATVQTRFFGEIGRFGATPENHGPPAGWDWLCGDSSPGAAYVSPGYES